MPRLWAAKGRSIGTRRLQPMLLNVELAPFFVLKGSFLRGSTCWTHKEQNGDFGGAGGAAFGRSMYCSG